LVVPNAKETVAALYEAWKSNNPDALDGLLTDDYVDHDAVPGFAADKEGAKQFLSAMMSVSKDVEMKVGHVVADGDHAAGHWTMDWTQIGDFMGMIPADGKRLSLRGHDFFRLKDGRIAETWHCEDIAGVMGQLGVIPQAG
jgi:steroid delta-isomerase-like uncharacterized protein